MIPVEELLPHAAPMLLLSGYEPAADEAVARAFVEITPDSAFYEPSCQGVPACVALEYMAQTMALLVGLTRRRKGLSPRVGFVLGARRLAISIPCFAQGARYAVSARCIYEDEEFGSFACQITDAHGAVVAVGTLTAFQPAQDGALEKLEDYA